jgi:hypothetical protein
VISLFEKAVDLVSKGTLFMISLINAFKYGGKERKYLQEVKYGYCNTQMLETDVSKQAVKLL